MMQFFRSKTKLTDLPPERGLYCFYDARTKTFSPPMYDFEFAAKDVMLSLLHKTPTLWPHMQLHTIGQYDTSSGEIKAFTPQLILSGLEAKSILDDLERQYEQGTVKNHQA